MRANTNISVREKKAVLLDDFRGVDFSSSPLSVSPRRATYMKNLIPRNGLNQKRYGWKEIASIKVSNNEVPVNGIFEYQNGERDELIIHAGTRFFRVCKDHGEFDWDSISDITPSGANITSSRSQAFQGGHKLFIIGCGDYLVYGSSDGGENYYLERVENGDETYIPTTTISIDNDLVSDTARSTLDEINMLTKKRKNQLLGVSEANRTWTLDAKIDSDSKVSILLETVESVEENNMTITENVKYLIENDISAENKQILRKIKRNNVNIAENTQVGTIDFSAGKITFSIPTTVQISGRDNIFVTFESDTGLSERITKCNFGVLFGENGNTDRLFLSGNPDYPAIDFHSASHDWTYFSTSSSSVVGNNSSAITGYLRLSDSTLAIFKEKNNYDATIFYRTEKTNISYDENGNISKVETIFPVSAGNIGETIVSRSACMSYCGDNLILSKNGIFGIVLPTNISTNERYAIERSKFISNRLRSIDLSEATAVIYDGKYILSADNQCFVADSEYLTADNSRSLSYEWWVWTNIPARVFAVVDGELMFATNGGKICIFDKSFSDKTIIKSELGDISINIPENNFEANEGIISIIAENDTVIFKTPNIYSKIFEQSEVNISNGRIMTDEIGISKIINGTEVYVDNLSHNLDSCGLELNKKYTITETDRGDYSFALFDESLNDGEGGVAYISDNYNGDIILLKCVTDKKLIIASPSISSQSFQVREVLGGEILRLSSYCGVTPSNIIADFVHSENVVAEWRTPTLDFGTNSESKTLLSLSVSTTPEVNGRLMVGYRTRNSDKIIESKGVNMFSFENFSFNNFSFETGFASSYTIKCKERNFNYIIFRFVSDNDCNCAVNNLKIIYKINSRNRGVR